MGSKRVGRDLATQQQSPGGKTTTPQIISLLYRPHHCMLSTDSVWRTPWPSVKLLPLHVRTQTRWKLGVRKRSTLHRVSRRRCSSVLGDFPGPL